jgi:hypothetical protein
MKALARFATSRADGAIAKNVSPGDGTAMAQ